MTQTLCGVVCTAYTLNRYEEFNSIVSGGQWCLHLNDRSY